MKKTSRGRLLDAVNMIAELVALASHTQELINVYASEIRSEDGNIEQTISKLVIQKDLLVSVVDQRRIIMSEIFEQHQGDHRLRCSTKHAISAYQFATECLYANPDSLVWVDLQQKAYENMIGVLGLFCGLDEFITCSRCLEDDLHSKKESGLSDV